MESFYNSGSESLVFNLFQGKAGMRKLSNMILKLTPSSREILVISSVSSIECAVGKEWLSAWVKLRTKRGIRTRGLVTEEAINTATLNIETNKQELRQTHLLPHAILMNAEINIFHNYVAVFFPVKEHKAFIIKSEEFSQSLGSLFEFLWGITKKV